MWDELRTKIKTLNETVWEFKANWPDVEQWLRNFRPDEPGQRAEQLHALFLLSQFMYFGVRELRELIRSLFRDVFAYPVIEDIRRANGDTTDRRFIGVRFANEVRATRFLGIGNPSESGTHLLYYFRQENALPKNLFINTHEIFSRAGDPDRTIRDPRVVRYVFLDDLCASGQQARQYSEQILRDLKALQPNARACYYILFATTDALEAIRTIPAPGFDDVRCVVELDPSFKCFGPTSRYFLADTPDIDKGFAEAMCRAHGSRLVPSHPLGYGDSQLLIGFHHNTPDSTLPIFWYDKRGSPWRPLFRRYPKLEW